ncbi:ESX-1 secretion-associated protein [Prauserella cavernicola]|uniref:ESX-1 secretion-associated protein n=1 Tax=Prauserella cavernicola TaxID=2800127 RepID=A0A934QRH6_9PSEU|nr:ESX-1 secretion-associated protein [Prauserella cavernicola]MBK1784049.1 ESX-1 secretion-associated protein [Prauserella cavernicola]
MSGGYDVDLPALRKYRENLGSYQGQAGKFADLVAKADVGDQSWGVVGLFTKSQYTETLGELKRHLTSMAEGLQSASDKIGAAADQYRAMDDEVIRLLKNVLTQLETSGGGRPRG